MSTLRSHVESHATVPVHNVSSYTVTALQMVNFVTTVTVYHVAIIWPMRKLDKRQFDFVWNEIRMLSTQRLVNNLKDKVMWNENTRKDVVANDPVA